MRHFVGYWRYDIALLFQPLKKTVIKEHQGARVTCRYDRAHTPYQRVVALSDDLVSPAQKAEFRRTLTRLQNQLWETDPVAGATAPITPGSD